MGIAEKTEETRTLRPTTLVIALRGRSTRNALRAPKDSSDSSC